MDRVRHLTPFFRAGRPARVVLRLRDRHSVAGTTTTFCAYASITATSSAVVGVLRRSSPWFRAGLICPNALKRTFAIERFMALPIISVSNVPDAPTNADDQHVVLDSWSPPQQGP